MSEVLESAIMAGEDRTPAEFHEHQSRMDQLRKGAVKKPRPPATPRTPVKPVNRHKITVPKVEQVGDEEPLVEEGEPETQVEERLTNDPPFQLQVVQGRHEVILIHEHFECTFKTDHICQHEHGFAFSIIPDQMTFKPMPGCSLILKLDGVPIKVVYAGGFYTFPNIPFALLSFLIDTNETPPA